MHGTETEMLTVLIRGLVILIFLADPYFFYKLIFFIN